MFFGSLEWPVELTWPKTLFIESWCDDERIIEENVRRVKISSPDVSIHLYSCCAFKLSEDLLIPISM